MANIRPAQTEYAQYYERYISLVSETDILSVLESQMKEIEKFGKAVSSDKETFRYDKDKWSIREVVGHLIDTEKVFGFRAFCFSRNEPSPLPSYDQDPYILNAHYNDIKLADLIDEFLVVRRSNLYVFKNLRDGEWDRKGIASDNPVTVRALAYMMAGHVRHHFNGLRTSYGIKF